MYQRNPRILKIEQESVLGVRCLCPPNMRPFEAYAVSSNGTFEFARLQRNFTCPILCFNRPELSVFKTEYKYQEINDHFTETYIGKVVQPMTLFKKQIQVFENTGKDFSCKYIIKGSVGSLIKNCLCPRLPCCCLRSTRFTITDMKSTKDDEDMEDYATAASSKQGEKVVNLE